MATENLRPGQRVRSDNGEGIVIARRGDEAKVLLKTYVSRWFPVEALTKVQRPRGASK